MPTEDLIETLREEAKGLRIDNHHLDFARLMENAANRLYELYSRVNPQESQIDQLQRELEAVTEERDMLVKNICEFCKKARPDSFCCFCRYDNERRKLEEQKMAQLVKEQLDYSDLKKVIEILQEVKGDKE